MGKWNSFSPERNEICSGWKRERFWKGAKYTRVIQRSKQGAVKYSLPAFGLKRVTISQSLLNKWQFSHKPKGEPFLCRIPSWESVDFVRVRPSKGQGYIKAEHITLEGVMLQQEANQSRVCPLAGVHFLLLQTRGGIISAFVETVTSGATWHYGNIHSEQRHQGLSEAFPLSPRCTASSKSTLVWEHRFPQSCITVYPWAICHWTTPEMRDRGGKTKKVEKADCAIKII